jgi:hypothetical protein
MPQTDIGNISDPELLRTPYVHPAGNMRVDPIAMPGICRLDPSLLPAALQILLVHQGPNALVANPIAPPAKLLGRSTVPVERELATDGMEFLAKLTPLRVLSRLSRTQPPVIRASSNMRQTTKPLHGKIA